MVQVSHEKAVRVIVKIRDARAEQKKKWEAADAVLKEQQEKIETVLLTHMNGSGIDSFKTAAGTAYKTVKLIPQGADWAVFYEWVKKHDAFDFIFKRIKADMVKDYMEQHNGKVPPGVSVYSVQGVTIRRT